MAVYGIVYVKVHNKPGLTEQDILNAINEIDTRGGLDIVHSSRTAERRYEVIIEGNSTGQLNSVANKIGVGTTLTRNGITGDISPLFVLGDFWD